MSDRIPARRNILKLLGILLLASGVMLGIRKYMDHSAREPSRSAVNGDGSFDSIHTFSQSAKQHIDDNDEKSHTVPPPCSTNL